MIPRIFMVGIKNLSKIYYSANKEPIHALLDISFSVEPGEFICLVGPSGAGKTTLIKLLIGEEKPTKGSILFNQLEVNRLKKRALQKLRRKVGVVHQDYKLLTSRTVRENLSYILEALAVGSKSIDRDIPQVLAIVGLENRANNFPSELSGGEKQRLAIARALVHRPHLVVADEPTGNLDKLNAAEIIKLLERINKMGSTVILSTHDEQIVQKLGKRVVALDKGRLAVH